MTVYTGRAARFDTDHGPVTGTVVSEPFWVNEPDGFRHQLVAVRLDRECQGYLMPGDEPTTFISTMLMSLDSVAS